MKKSELKKYIKENIISELSEDKETQQNAKDTEELTKAVEDLAKAKEEAGIVEKAAKSSDDVIDPADYGVIGQNYLAGFGRENTLDLDSLEKLGRKIVAQIFKGDFDKAKAKFIKEEIPNTSMLKINNVVKSASTAAKSMIDFYNQMAEKEQMDFMKNAKFKLAIDKLQDLAGDEEEAPVTEDEEEVFNPDAKVKKTKGLAKAKEELALLTREMKSLAKKYSKAEGADKEKLVKILKDKTKLKKELESILDNKKI